MSPPFLACMDFSWDRDKTVERDEEAAGREEEEEEAEAEEDEEEDEEEAGKEFNTNIISANKSEAVPSQERS